MSFFFFYVQGEVVFPTPQLQGGHLLPVSRLVEPRDQTHHNRVVSELHHVV